ncbi:hypothetical protein [Marivirga sp.]|uniref:hypothetical protein n=1 Tax=Marivirga sp. TaxID=2018662 RepID=UPI0025D75AD5|nr:hypothetical protein [Marivirga sp.]
MKKFPLYFLLLLLFSCQSCQLFDKEEDTLDPQEELAKLPPITATGENTFGCLVNGKAFLPVQGFLGANALDGYVNSSNKFVLQALNIQENYNLNIQIIDLNSFSGDLTISTTNVLGDKDLVSFTKGDNRYDDLIAGELNIIKDDRDSSIIAGTFTITFDTGNGELEISEGRFDLKY